MRIEIDFNGRHIEFMSYGETETEEDVIKKVKELLEEEI